MSCGSLSCQYNPRVVVQDDQTSPAGCAPGMPPCKPMRPSAPGVMRTLGLPPGTGFSGKPRKAPAPGVPLFAKPDLGVEQPNPGFVAKPRQPVTPRGGQPTYRGTETADSSIDKPWAPQGLRPGVPAQARQPGKPVFAPQGKPEGQAQPAFVPKPAQTPVQPVKPEMVTAPQDAFVRPGETVQSMSPKPTVPVTTPKTPVADDLPGSVAMAPNAKSAGAFWMKPYRPAGDPTPPPPCGRPASISETDWANMTRLRQQDYIDQCEADPTRRAQMEAYTQAQADAERNRILSTASDAFRTTASTIIGLVERNQNYLLERRRLENAAQRNQLSADYDRARLETETALRQLQATPGATSDPAIMMLMTQMQQQAEQMRLAAEEAKSAISPGVMIAGAVGLIAVIGGGILLATRGGGRRSSRDNPPARRRRRR